MLKVALINHGCAKNLVDSELMLGMIADAGFEITLDDESADIVIVNTCSFIQDAEQESVQSILQMVYSNKKVIVTGCLPQKHKKELKKAIPEVVAMLGTTDYAQIVDIIKEIANNKNTYVEKISDNPKYIYAENVSRQQITMGASSYIKIADGCNFNCGYCIIPKLRGKYSSRKIEDIVKETEEMAQKGVSEIVLIAQDTTSYGIDLYGEPKLADLLKELNKIEKLNWIRILYTYPSMFTDDLIDAIANLDKVVKYLDIPLQHANNDILTSMRRPKMDYKSFIQKLRDKIPNLSLRTTFIVGYPGETEEQYQELYDFVQEMKFDKMGVFTYSREENTYSYDLPNQIDEKTKQDRKDKLMELQSNISLKINESMVGTTVPCIIEALTQDGIIVARTYKDAPEIDGVCYISTEEPLVPGDIELVEITDADEYDLWGVING